MKGILKLKLFCEKPSVLVITTLSQHKFSRGYSAILLPVDSELEMYSNNFQESLLKFMNCSHAANVSMLQSIRSLIDEV
jgi:hypothetical protein